MQTILIVDEEAPTRELLAAYLRGEGRRVLEATSSAAGLELAAAEHADLALVDLDLGGLGGLQTMRQLKRQVPDEYLPVIVIVPFGDPATRMAAWEAGADEVLPRPVHRLELLQRIESLLGLRRERDQLARANAELLRLQQYKDNLDILIVHDLRNPLTALSANLEFVLGEVSADARPDLRDAADDALSASRRLQRMVSSITDVAAFEGKALHPRPARFELAPLLADLRRLHRYAASERQVRLEVECAADLSCTADVELLVRVLENMMEALLRRTPRAGHLTVTATGNGSLVRVAVASSGPPIPREQHGNLFEKFGPVTIPDGEPRVGTGLGLYFCRLAVEAHGGRIGLADDDALCLFIELPEEPPPNR